MSDHVELSRDIELDKLCRIEERSRTANSFISNSSILDKILQPFNFISHRVGPYGYIDQPFANIEPILYLGIFTVLLLPFVLLLKYLYSTASSLRHSILNIKKLLSKNENRLYLYLWLIFSLFFLGFYIQVAVYYWYLLPVLPIVAVFIIKLYSKLPQYKYFVSFLVVTTVFNFIAVVFLPKSTTIKDFLRVSVDVSEYLNLRPGLVLDASENDRYVPLAYLDNYTSRVVRSRYYFEVSKLSLGEMHQELKRNKVKYIVVNSDVLQDSWYAGCAERNNKKLGLFLSLYTDPVLDIEGNPLVYRLK